MRILLIGAGGQLAEDLCAVLASEEILAASHSELDIGDPAAVATFVEKLRPECVINTAAFNLVDACEDRSEEAFRVNTLGVYYLARAAKQAGARLVHFSTNYVFDGGKNAPYNENDLPHPLSIYAQSKLGGEWAAQQYCEKHFVIRTAALYGRAGNKSKGGNFVERLIRNADEGKPLRIVNDQIVNPTYTLDLAQSVGRLIRTERYGLYHT
ncbi:MAG: dTDP-4-dehydrorhamnose reductase, partial [Acidobacteria bacterium]|nr:dTDP-4-dehydrorhamnose reductase [Acidobacteriota bacterium]